MIMECVGAIQWDHPAIFGPVVAALTAGIFLIVTTLINRNKPSSPAVVVIPPEKDMGPALTEAVDPLRQEIKSIREQLAQLAPKQQVPDSGEPLKIKAVEFFNAGLDAYHQGEAGQAIGHWLDALQLDPDSAAAHNNLGVALQAKGELNAAIEHLSATMRIEPNDPFAYYNFGALLREKGELDAAIEQYNIALRIGGHDADTHAGLGIALKDKGELDAAIEHCNAALRIDPDYARVHFNLGCVLAQKKNATAAVAALAKAMELDPAYQDKAKNDADSDPIRDDHAFRKLVDAE